MADKNINRTMKVYCCAECGEVKLNTATPPKEKCWKYIFHRWVNLSESGAIRYTCANCGVTVATAKTPSSYGCRETGFHKWERE